MAMMPRYAMPPGTAQPTGVEPGTQCEVVEMFYTQGGITPRPCADWAVARLQGQRYCAFHLDDMGWRLVPGDPE